jgi:hypothetical protein
MSNILDAITHAHRRAIESSDLFVEVSVSGFDVFEQCSVPAARKLCKSLGMEPICHSLRTMTFGLPGWRATLRWASAR